MQSKLEAKKSGCRATYLDHNRILFTWNANVDLHASDGVIALRHVHGKYRYTQEVTSPKSSQPNIHRLVFSTLEFPALFGFSTGAMFSRLEKKERNWTEYLQWQTATHIGGKAAKEFMIILSLPLIS